MKMPLFILNAISAIFLANTIFNNPSITGFATSSAESGFRIPLPLIFVVLFILATIALDIYFYLKTKKLGEAPKNMPPEDQDFKNL